MFILEVKLSSPSRYMLPVDFFAIDAFSNLIFLTKCLWTCLLRFLLTNFIAPPFEKYFIIIVIFSGWPCPLLERCQYLISIFFSGGPSPPSEKLSHFIFFVFFVSFLWGALPLLYKTMNIWSFFLVGGGPAHPLQKN